METVIEYEEGTAFEQYVLENLRPANEQHGGTYLDMRDGPEAPVTAATSSHSSLIGNPASASRRKPMIRSSVNRFFMSNLLRVGLDSKATSYSNAGRRRGHNPLGVRKASNRFIPLNVPLKR